MYRCTGTHVHQKLAGVGGSVMGCLVLLGPFLGAEVRRKQVRAVWQQSGHPAGGLGRRGVGGWMARPGAPGFDTAHPPQAPRPRHRRQEVKTFAHKLSFLPPYIDLFILPSDVGHGRCGRAGNGCRGCRMRPPRVQKQLWPGGRMSSGDSTWGARCGPSGGGAWGRWRSARPCPGPPALEESPALAVVRVTHGPHSPWRGPGDPSSASHGGRALPRLVLFLPCVTGPPAPRPYRCLQGIQPDAGGSAHFPFPVLRGSLRRSARVSEPTRLREQLPRV